MTTNPTLVEVVRGDIVESRHVGRAVVMDAQGQVRWSCGDIEELTYPRSALKAFQALPMVASGAADRYGFSDQQLALACASHNGEVSHHDCAAAMLEQLTLDAEDLECGWHWPMSDVATRELVAQGITPDALHNNCSGKHCGMLALASHQGWPTRGYVELDHPVQQSIRKAIEVCWGVDLERAPVALDGCSAPIWAVPLRALAQGFARLAAPASLPDQYQAAATRLLNACLQHPWYVAGSDRFCSRLMTELGDQVFVKLGAEGVYVAAIPSRALGVAVKVDSGDIKAVEVAIANVLARLGLPVSGAFTRPDIRNRKQRLTGHYQAATALSSPLAL
ncbi:asparaginase [Aestuariirhabdus sp. Z084]|uniref:asparaginase n=1 Tax=Aestuariirhabdus haliotis TaxID=2918751 RepID=UPI00201B3BA7|nr:asparaginase [Aestuariirhabdus haliotis]MCL6416576.1 asparaginase [Aestuariirhabdus haliotis]MCL6420557.1 asparaginase [Aestuariirhabdus haliotis]